MAKHGWKGFGIHPHIAENQPHEVRTLGMNHPVGLFAKRFINTKINTYYGHGQC